MYRRVVYPVLQRVDAERTHDLVLRLLAGVERSIVLRNLVQRMVAFEDSRLHVSFAGLHFANPLGLAAGLDKNAVAVETWGALGFGHVEIGTVTPLPQSGNPQPRMFRLAADEALINRMGFPGRGVPFVASQLRRRTSGSLIVGANIGANKTSVESGRPADDYVAALEQLYALADYVTINISSPNTARLRELQGRSALNALVEQVVARRNTLPVRKPLLIKIAPDLTTSELDDVIAVCVSHEVDGIVATNTTIGRPPTLRSPSSSEGGGLSGRPLRDRSNDIIRYLHTSTRGALPIVGVGGIFTAADVWAKLGAGAQLVQVYTGFVYEGPLMARRINRTLVKMMEQHGIHSLSEVIGKG